MIAGMKLNIFLCCYVSSLKLRPYSSKVASLQNFQQFSSIRSESNYDICRTIRCSNAEDIENIGWNIAEYLGNGDVIILRGSIGAGKTCFSRGVIRNKFDEEHMKVTSPSYLLDNSYEYNQGQYIHHIDLYRLPNGCDLNILGIPRIFETSLCLIEWPERLKKDDYPQNYLEINFKIMNNFDTSKEDTNEEMNGINQYRLLEFRPYGSIWKNKLENFFHELTLI